MFMPWAGCYKVYECPLMVEFWTAISFGKPDKVPHGVPRRLFCPLPWEPTSLDHWTLIKVYYYTLNKKISSIFIER
ncbi:putative bicarbonate transporter [Lupinus albus]|uniref:Putative bicarbonate transporter n=1 Tax=Lupinus albus TaxID=3870 RepID=A0A6A4MWA0_LUPAL|nr:putative bicarbonate transporter [Lupinus albus]